jgi:hypothetical protein
MRTKGSRNQWRSQGLPLILISYRALTKWELLEMVKRSGKKANNVFEIILIVAGKPVECHSRSRPTIPPRAGRRVFIVNIDLI